MSIVIVPLRIYFLEGRATKYNMKITQQLEGFYEDIKAVLTEDTPLLLSKLEGK